MAAAQQVVELHHGNMEDQFKYKTKEFFGYFFVGVLVLFISSLALRVCLKGQKSPSCTSAVDGGSFLWNFLIIFSGTMIGLASIDILRRFYAIYTSVDVKRNLPATSAQAPAQVDPVAAGLSQATSLNFAGTGQPAPTRGTQRRTLAQVRTTGANAGSRAPSVGNPVFAVPMNPRQ